MYNWHATLGLLSGLLIFFAIVPYIRDVLKHKTRPNAVSWFGWTLLLSIGAAAQIKEGASFSVLLLVGDIVGTGITFLLSLQYGVTKYTLFDRLSLIFGLLAIGMWVVTQNPLTALVLSVVADLIVSLPTVKKAVTDPLSETPSSFVMFALAAALGVISTTKIDVANLLFPVYLLVINSVIAVASLRGRSVIK